MTDSKITVLIAGATGYLGRHLVTAYHKAGHRVHVLARHPEKLISLDDQIDRVIFGEATQADTLADAFDDIDLVVSALGITSQRDGLRYDDVDYQANMNLLDAAVGAGVAHFAYVHVLHAEAMLHVPMAAAKARFAKALADAPIGSTVICPSGFYSDLAELLEMARKGRIFLFGNGEARMSPIDGADLAAACVGATRDRISRIHIGGPQSLSQNEIAHKAFEALGMRPRITHIPLGLTQFLLNCGKKLGWGQQLGPIEFFLAASQIDMTAPAHGSITLAEDFARRADGKKHSASFAR
ncbi:SDR family oxidoreductase [Sphingorhabdus sp. SMR4y]|uniref:SDR family oxidoreductase n=1 Tax=Sphingorhabdus sp. SMR4y TaxID=2584094 RepID=UPI000B5CC447|nr:NAD(P)H-binding protein [Sphingorhabdus sp. SMR4y]ASK89480.1 short chain dehydrogenase [Sphingorhabdus sp. SMR4y]